MNTLWTPTDWNAECDLMKEYLNYVAEMRFAESEFIQQYNNNSKHIFKMYKEMGLMFVAEPAPVYEIFKVTPFWLWKLGRQISDINLEILRNRNKSNFKQQ